MTRKKRIGILTGGGDCPGLNAVIRAAVRTAIRDHDMKVFGIQLGFEGLLTGSTIPLTSESIRGILPKGGTLLRTTNRGNPFEFPVGDGRVEDRSKEAIESVERLGLHGIIAIGGDGTLKIAQRLCDLGVPMVAVPKTIDNDLAATDYTFGFMTAVAVATDAVDRLHTTAESHDRVMILGVMGRKRDGSRSTRESPAARTSSSSRRFLTVRQRSCERSATGRSKAQCSISSWSPKERSAGVRRATSTRAQAASEASPTAWRRRFTRKSTWRSA
jgi:hypothetical protein